MNYMLCYGAITIIIIVHWEAYCAFFSREFCESGLAMFSRMLNFAFWPNITQLRINVYYIYMYIINQEALVAFRPFFFKWEDSSAGSTIALIFYLLSKKVTCTIVIDMSIVYLVRK